MIGILIVTGVIVLITGLILYGVQDYLSPPKKRHRHYFDSIAFEERQRKEKAELEQKIEQSLNGEYIKKKYYLKQNPTAWTKKYCQYCGTELVNVSFTDFCYRYKDTGLYYCVNCNLETKDFMKGEKIEC